MFSWLSVTDQGQGFAPVECHRQLSTRRRQKSLGITPLTKYTVKRTLGHLSTRFGDAHAITRLIGPSVRKWQRIVLVLCCKSTSQPTKLCCIWPSSPILLITLKLRSSDFPMPADSLPVQLQRTPSQHPALLLLHNHGPKHEWEGLPQQQTPPYSLSKAATAHWSRWRWLKLGHFPPTPPHNLQDKQDFAAAMKIKVHPTVAYIRSVWKQQNAAHRTPPGRCFMSAENCFWECSCLLVFHWLRAGNSRSSFLGSWTPLFFFYKQQGEFALFL